MCEKRQSGRIATLANNGLPNNETNYKKNKRMSCSYIDYLSFELKYSVKNSYL